MKRLLTAFAVAGALAVGASSALAQNILLNGSLDVTYQQLIVDNAPPGPGAEDLFLPKPDLWVNVGTRTITGPYEDEMSSEPWAGPAPTPVTTGGSDGGDWAVFFKPFSGNATDGPATGHLYQDRPATPGKRYVLTGWAGAEANALMQGAEFAVEFLDGGGGVIGGSTLNLMPTLFVDNGLSFDYKQYSVAALAPAGTVSVRARASMIGATSNPAGGGQAYVVDDFSMVEVPEPNAIALIGVAFAAMAARRRRS